MAGILVSSPETERVNSRQRFSVRVRPQVPDVLITSMGRHSTVGSNRMTRRVKEHSENGQSWLEVDGVDALIRLLLATLT